MNKKSLMITKNKIKKIKRHIYIDQNIWFYIMRYLHNYVYWIRLLKLKLIALNKRKKILYKTAYIKKYYLKNLLKNAK
jgi:hypothetical protein